jgi:hypothetical protein
MKIFIPVILSVFCFHHSGGQTNVMAHLFKDETKELVPFISPTFQYSEIALQNSAIPGIRAGVIISEKITVGALYNFTLNNLHLPEQNGSGKFTMQWGGLHFEYTLWPRQKIHLTFPLSAGLCKIRTTGNTTDSLAGNPSFIFAEPGLMMEINIWKYAKLGIGTSYRYTGKVSHNFFTSSDISGFAAIVSVKFGMFNYQERE